jgi:hypothetical protein
MKNYLKFIVAVFTITIATFGSINVKAKQLAVYGTCSNTLATCGTTSGGNVITGNYIDEQAN